MRRRAAWVLGGPAAEVANRRARGLPDRPTVKLLEGAAEERPA